MIDEMLEQDARIEIKAGTRGEAAALFYGGKFVCYLNMRDYKHSENDVYMAVEKWQREAKGGK